jgi:leader peptidase (prepilin peptidase) / N-methyltransferase
VTVVLLPVVVFGVMVGSFLNVCIGRLPAGESIVSPGSHCPSCGAPIRWFDNVPIISYLMLRGRCRSCRSGISLRYPLVEAITAAAFLVDGLLFQHDLLLLVQRLVFTGLLIVLFGTDLETQRLPNVLTLPGVLVGLIFSLGVPPGFQSCAIGALLGGGLLWAVRWGWKRATGVEGMGLGDVKMLAMIGAFLGWQQVWTVLVFASVGGALVGVALTMLGRRSLHSRLAFGTFLAAAAYAASLFGEPLVAWYVRLLQS